MALITCPDCGKEFSDQAAACPNCGRPNKAVGQPAEQPQIQPQLQPPKEGKPKNTKLSIAALIVVILGTISTTVALVWIGIILGVIDFFIHRGKRKFAVLVTAFIISVFGVIYCSVSNSSEQEQTEPVATAESEVSSTDVQVAEETESEETRDEFIASCVEISYNDLLRYPEEHTGERIVITAEIQQIIEGGFLDGNTYYRVLTDNSDLGLYLDDEYLMVDDRIEDDTRLIQGDIITIYAEYEGLQTITRALTDTEEEVPAISAKYIDIIGENGEEPTLSSEELALQMDVSEYGYTSYGSIYYVLVITNNSPVTVTINTNVVGKDSEGNNIGAESGYAEAIESGHSAVISHLFYDSQPESFEYTLETSEASFYQSASSDIIYEENDTGNGIVMTCTNNGEEAASGVEGTVLFFLGEELVYCETQYFSDSDFELKAGASLTEEFDCDESYDSYQIYITAIRY